MQWVKDFAVSLAGNRVQVSLDLWDCAPGTDLAEYMEVSIRECDYVIIVCTPIYATRSNGRQGGVGFETGIITGEIFHKTHRKGKFIPVIREGFPETAIPSYLRSVFYVDARAERLPEALEQLLDHFYDSPKYARPPLGSPPIFTRKKKTPEARSSKTRSRPKRERSLVDVDREIEEKQRDFKTTASSLLYSTGIARHGHLDGASQLSTDLGRLLEEREALIKKREAT